MNKPLFKLINKKFIITIVTSSVFVTSLTIAAIWFYLSSLDRLDIFFDAVNVNSSPGIIFFFLILLTIGFSGVFFISSFILVLILKGYEDNLKDYTTMSPRFSSVCFFNSLIIGFMVTFGYSIYYITELNGFLITAITIAVSITLSYFLTNRNLFCGKTLWGRSPARNFYAPGSEEAEKLSKENSSRVNLSLLLMIPGIAQVLPMIAMVPHIDFSEGTSNWLAILILIILNATLATAGIFPGSIYANEMKKGNEQTTIFLVMVSLLGMITVFSVLCRPIPYMIINMAMSLPGISDSRTHSYYIDTKSSPPGLFNNTLWNTRYYKDIPDKFFITGISMFTFGNIKLICPSEIIKARVENLKLTLNNPNKDDENSNKLKNAAAKCITFDKKDIYTWDSPLSEPIYYEKVKMTTDNSLLKILHAMK